jgi:hypothetical protein
LEDKLKAEGYNVEVIISLMPVGIGPGIESSAQALYISRARRFQFAVALPASRV